MYVCDDHVVMLWIHVVMIVLDLVCLSVVGLREDILSIESNRSNIVNPSSLGRAKTTMRQSEVNNMMIYSFERSTLHAVIRAMMNSMTTFVC